ncbi:MAG: CTP synthase, partial [Blastomonas sp.]|nr:CTP synthase [Blastomonas sp.]
LDLYNDQEPNLDSWKDFLGKFKNPTEQITVGLVGKYVELKDAYKSIAEAFIHAGAVNECKVKVEWISSETLDQEEVIQQLLNLDGILVAPGFGERGLEGKIHAVQLARENKIPFFGICLGMQMACIEAARNTSGIENASTTEFGETDEPIVGLITEWMSESGLQKRSAEGDLGGTMRLGAFPAKLSGNSRVRGIYGTDLISERHRHRYEVNTAYHERLEKGGLVFSGMSPDGVLPEIVERPDHSWFVGVQYHPELKSKPFDPHPLFASFIEAAVAQSRLV